MKNIKEINVKVTKENWDKAIDKAFNKQKKDIKIDGFRKGSCPKDVYIKKVGIETLYMPAANICIDEEMPKVIKDNNILPVCTPSVDIVDISENGIEFKFTFIEKPEVKVGKYNGFKIKKNEIKVSDDEVGEEIKALSQKYADIVECTEGTLEKGHTAIIDFEGFVDGEKLEGGTGANYPLEIGSNTFIPGFEDGLIGMSIGEERTLNLKFPEEYVDNLKNKDVVFNVKLNSFKKRVLPELNEDFYKDLGFKDIKTEAEFRETIKNGIAERKTAEEENRYTDEVLKKAVDAVEVQINPEIIEDESEHMIEHFSENLKVQGITFDQYLEFTKMTKDDFKKKMEPECVQRIKTRYLLEAVIEKEKIDVTEEEVKAEIKKICDTYQITEQEVLNSTGGEEYIRYDLKMMKALDILKK